MFEERFWRCLRACWASGSADHGGAIRHIGHDDGGRADGGAVAEADIAEDARSRADGDVIADAWKRLYGTHADGHAADEMAMAANRDRHDDGPNGMGDIESGANRHAG